MNASMEWAATGGMVSEAEGCLISVYTIPREHWKTLIIAHCTSITYSDRGEGSYYLLGKLLAFP